MKTAPILRLPARLLALTTALFGLAAPAWGQNGTWTNLLGGSWTNAANWSGGIIATNVGNTANFNTLALGSSPTVTLDEPVSIGNLLFGDTGNAYGWTLNPGIGGTLTLTNSSGSVINVSNQTATVGVVLAGPGGLSKQGTGTLVLSGANTYTGPTIISNGVVTYSGSGGSSGDGNLYMGTNSGSRVVLNMGSSGTVSFGASSGAVDVGGIGSAAGGAGVINQTAGTVDLTGTIYVELGDGGYGSYALSGGALNFNSTTGLRVGDYTGGQGVYLQTGGTCTMTRYFVIGGNNGTAPAGVATLTGGTLLGNNNSSYYFILGNGGTASSTLNIGTDAGGNAVFASRSSVGIQLNNSGTTTNTLNLDSGTIQFSAAGGIYKNTVSGGLSVVNFNGGTLQVTNATGFAIINNTPDKVNVYNGGLTVDTQGNAVTNAARMLATAGSGVYPVGGTYAITSGGGSGYLGAPLVTVTNNGSGTGLTAIANVSGGVVTGVTITCPGQNFAAGNVLGFGFSGGGAVTPAGTYLYTLTAGDLSVNAIGGLTKIGSGTLTLSTNSTYTGNTAVNAGTLNVTADGGLGKGNVVVANSATLTLGGGITNGYIANSANLVLGTAATANLNFTGTNTINGLSINGGVSYVAAGTYGSSGSPAASQSALFTGTGVINVTAQPAGATVALTASANPSQLGQSVTFTATVSGSGGTPTGTVTFENGSAVLGTVALNGSGVATLTTGGLAIGTHPVTAIYGGNGTYSSAVSSPVSQVVNPVVDIWTGSVSSVWDVNTTSNWSNLGSAAVYNNGNQVQFDDSATGGTAVTLGVTVSPYAVVFTNNAKNYSLGGAGSIGGTGGLSLLGSGTLTVSNFNSFSGATVIGGGVLTYAGAGGGSGAGVLSVGGGNGTGTLNINTTNSLAYGGYLSVGGLDADTSDTGAGAIDQTAGSLNLSQSSVYYLELGAGGTGAYGCYNLSGGTLNTGASGIRVGADGLGGYFQSGGTLTCGRYLAVGAATGGESATGGHGVATFTGGTATVASSFWVILGNAPGGAGVMNLGTEAGGSATVSARYSSSGAGGVQFLSVNTAGSGVLNLNGGTLELAGAIYQNDLSSGSAELNFNGGTLQAWTNDMTLVNNTVVSANVYNGGAVIDTQGNTVTNAATLVTASGNGIYPAGGTLAVTNGGTGYLGAPLVAVAGGSGYGAMAIANLSGGTVGSVTLTCPGQNYQVGDDLSFTFSGGGTTNAAGVFNYTLQAGDVAANGAGGLTKLGTGTLLLTANNSYTGPTAVKAGKLVVSTAASGAGAYTLTNGTELDVAAQFAGAQLAMSNLTFAGPVSATLDFDLTAAGSLTAAPVNVTGTLADTGTVTINLLIGGISTGEYPLIQYGSLGGAGNYVLGALPVGVVAHLVTNTVASPNSIDLVVTSAGQPKWTGAANGNWDILTTTNWVDELTSQSETYQDGQPVLFDDSATGTTAVVLATNVHPGAVTFNNTALAYTLTGTNKISGSTGLTMQGAGTVTIANTTLNDYTGVTVVGGGTLTVTNLGNGGLPSNIGAASASPANLVFTNGGSLNYAGPATTINRGYTVGMGGGALTLNGNLTLSGQVAPVTGASFIKNGPGTLTYNNAGTNLLSAGGSTNAFGIAAGTVVLNGTGGSQTESVQGSVWVGFYGTTNGRLVLTNTTLAIAGQLAMDVGNGGLQSQVAVDNSTLNCGSIALNSNSTLNASGPVLNVAGTSAVTNTGSLWIGHATGAGVLNISGSATVWNGSTGIPTLDVGGTGSSGDSGVGAVNQTGGTAIFGPGNDVYLQFGAGASAYGAYNLSGGTLITSPTDGIRLGYGGLGSYLQTGGTLSCGRYFVVGANAGFGVNDAVATFLGGSATVNSSYYVIIGNLGGATGILNLGTEAGGTAALLTAGSTGPNVGNISGANGTLNLNHGILTLGGPILTVSGATGFLNLNGGTVQAGANGVTLINNTVNNAGVFNGGVVFDTQTNAATVSANLLATAGYGAYPAGGTWSITSGSGGGGYIGAPVVAVSGGSGSGITAIANVTNGVLGGVTVTSPGQNYQVGDTLYFAFAGGGATNVAGTFSYTLTPADVVSNGIGGLTKIGTGTLTLAGTNTYTGVTVVSNGTVSVTGALGGGGAVSVVGGTLGGNGFIAGAVTVSSNATLAAGAGSIGTLVVSNNLTFAVGATNHARLNHTLATNDTVAGLAQVTYAGTLAVTNIAGTLAAGDSFQLFSAGSYAGAFTAIVPATPGAGLAWDASQLPVSGTLRVVSGVNTTPTNLVATVSGNTLSLAWPADHIGWRLLEQTNNLPAGISSNPADWGTVGGSAATNLENFTINPALPAEFYRLVYP